MFFKGPSLYKTCVGSRDELFRIRVTIVVRIDASGPAARFPPSDISYFILVHSSTSHGSHTHITGDTR